MNLLIRYDKISSRLDRRQAHMQSSIHSQGRNQGDKGGIIPRTPTHYGGAEKSEQCRKYVL